MLANCSRSKIIGIDIVKIKIFDGFFRTLGDVIHTPNLRKNFVTLSRLDTLSYYFLTMNEFIEVGKGSLVIMKDKKEK